MWKWCPLNPHWKVLAEGWLNKCRERYSVASQPEGGCSGTENCPTTEMQKVLKCQMFECYATLIVYLSHLAGIPKRPHLKNKN